MTHPTILIADDDEKLLFALSERLKREGMKVITCRDAYMATDLARRHTPDVILLDLNMPAGRGDSTHERLKLMKETASIPVIYLTGESGERVYQCAKSLGAFAVVLKPFDPVELIAYVRAAAELRSPHETEA
jgi:DNA-binding response OmpR family regulator